MLVGLRDFLECNIAITVRVEVVPDFVCIFARQADSHAFHGREEVLFANLSLSTLIHETEHRSDVLVLVLDPGEYQAHQLFDILELSHADSRRDLSLL